jgi:hypothetical protein
MSFTSDNPLLSNPLPISLDVNPDEANFDSVLLLYLRRVANAVNTKEQALYLLQETGDFQQWWTYLPASTTPNPQETRNNYRTTTDLVALNGGNIPAGTTTLTLTSSTTPTAINGYLFPTDGYGGALDTSGNSYFPSDPNVTISFNGSTNTFTIVNNTGNALTWCVFVLEYLKN